MELEKGVGKYFRFYQSPKDSHDGYELISYIKVRDETQDFLSTIEVTYDGKFHIFTNGCRPEYITCRMESYSGERISIETCREVTEVEFNSFLRFALHHLLTDGEVSASTRKSIITLITNLT